MGCALGVFLEERSRYQGSLAWVRPTSRVVVAPPPVGGLARCLVRRGDELHAYVGTVVRIIDARDVLHTSESTATGVEIALLGAQSRRLVLCRPELVACDAAGAHRWDDRRVVSARQRRGEPADVVARKRTSPAAAPTPPVMPSAEVTLRASGSLQSRADSTDLGPFIRASVAAKRVRPASPMRRHHRGGEGGL